MIDDAWIQDLLHLKRTPRTGWFRVGIESPESVADHCFSAALLAWRLGKEAPDVDERKLVLMMLLHDFHEARLSDIPTPAKKHFGEGEIAAAEERIQADQWSADREALDLLREFHEGETPEAKLAKALDHLEFLIQARFYRDAGKPLTEAMLSRARNSAAWDHPITKPYAQALLTSGETE